MKTNIDLIRFPTAWGYLAGVLALLLGLTPGGSGVALPVDEAEVKADFDLRLFPPLNPCKEPT